MTTITDTLLQLCLGLSAVLLAILLLRPLILNSLGAPAAYRLWLAVPLWLALACLTLLLPAAISGLLPVPASALLLDPLQVSIATAPNTSGEFLPLAIVALVCWLGGTLAMLALLSFRGWLSTRLLKNSRPLPDSLQARIRPELFDRIRIGPGPGSPMVTGIFRSRILLPDDCTRFDCRTLELILRHESVHLRRHDNLINLLAEILLALMWFNPLAWLARRAFRTDQELACDARALADLPAQKRTGYARAMLDLAATQPVPRAPQALACPWHSPETLKRRINMIDHHHPQHFRHWPGILLLAALTAAAVFVLPVSGSTGPTPDSNAVEDPIVIVRVAPVYPQEAIEQKLGGHVIAEFTVTEHGSVEDIQVIESAPGDVFDAAAIEAFSKWKFRPDVVDGVPLPFRARQMILFEMEQD